MIIFKQKEEKNISLFYANKMNNPLAVSILNKGEVENSDEATGLVSSEMASKGQWFHE